MCEDVIRTLGGHVAQYLGDGILVYFGYPRTHEDTADRAVRAALGILQTMPHVNRKIAEQVQELAERPLQLRIGIHSGPVVVGEMGAEGQTQPLALGQTVNVAARLQEQAEPDTAILSEATRRLLGDPFELELLGERALKGFTEPLVVHRVHALAEGSAAEAEPPPRARLVGREQEVALLLDRWEQARDGHGQVILLKGEAGIGKSRLVDVLRRQLAGQEHTWLEGRCSIYHENSPLHPVVEFLNQAFFEPSDGDPEKVAKLEEALKATGLDPVEVVPILCRLLAIPLQAPYQPSHQSPETQRQRILESLDTWLRRLAEQQPVCLVVEDMHWVDPSTSELLGLFLDQVPTARILLLMTSRPGFDPHWAERSELLHLSLNRLTRGQVSQLAEELTHGVPLPPPVLAEIVKKSDGVPLFVEELTKMVIESELVEQQEGRYELTSALLDLAIPSTLYDSLMARLDRLGRTKEVAQLASVLGRSFSLELLEAVFEGDRATVDRALAQLVDAELLYRRGLGPLAEFSFKHALIQDIAYQSLLKKHRQSMHRRAAETLEARFPARAREVPEAVARHFEEALLSEQAIAWYQRAGQLASERSAHQEAVAHLRHGIALLDELAPGHARSQGELQLQVALGSPLMAVEGYASAEVEKAFARARALAGELGEEDQRFRATWGLAAFYQARGDLETARSLAAELLATADAAADPTLELLANVTAGATCYYRGEWAQALAYLDRALQHYDPSRHQALAPGYGQDPGVIAGVFAGIARCHRGEPERGLAEAQGILERARNAGAHPLVVAFGLDFLSLLHFLRREPDAVIARTREALEIGEKYGFVLEQRLAQLMHGWAQTALGESAGLELVQQAIEALSELGALVGAPLFVGMLAEAQANVGGGDDALRTLEGARQFADALDAHFWDAELNRQTGELLQRRAAPGDDARVEEHLRSAVALAEREGSHWLGLRAATSLGGWLRDHDASGEAHVLVDRALAGLADGEETPDAVAARGLLEG
jgi:predicted ATPase